jgi:hypothetical protein
MSEKKVGGSEQKENIVNRVILPFEYYYGLPKKEENSEKEKKTILDKFSIENLQKKNSEGNDDFFSLALSSINKIDEPPLKYGGLEEIGDDLAIKKK